MKRFLFAAVLAAFLVSFSATVAEARVPVTIKRINDLRGKDGIELGGVLARPTKLLPGVKYPVIAVSAAWGGGDTQNIVPSYNLASHGYIVVTYTTRGTSNSGGKIELASTNDTDDLSQVINWLLANMPADPDRVGAIGASYGGGIALIAAARDPRIKSVAVTSAWTDMLYSLYRNDTISGSFAFWLLQSAKMNGHPSNDFLGRWSRLFKRGDRFENNERALQSSAIRYIDQINANGTAVFMANQWNDLAFPPDQLVTFYNQLQHSKKLQFRAGDHVVQETQGLLTFYDPVWSQVYQWMDKTLKSGDPEAGGEGIDLQVRTSVGPKLTEHYESWDQVGPGRQRFNIGPTDTARRPTGTLTDTPQTGWTRTLRPNVNWIISPGFPIIGGFYERISRPTTIPLRGIDRKGAGVWVGNPLAQPLKLRGATKLHTTVTPSAKKGTVTAYLYDVGPRNTAAYITHMPFTWLDNPPGKPLTLDFTLQSNAYDLPAGHRLALVVTTWDLLFPLDVNPPGSTLVFSSPASDPSYVEVPVR